MDRYLVLIKTTVGHNESCQQVVDWELFDDRDTAVRYRDRVLGQYQPGTTRGVIVVVDGVTL